MPNKECTERADELLISELQRMTREAVDYLSKKKAEILAKRKKQIA